MITNHVDTAQTDVMAVLDGRLEAMRAKDIDRAMSFYAPGIVYFDVIPPHQFVGADAVRRYFLRWFAEYQGDIELKTHDLCIAVSGNVAFAHMLHPDSGTRRSRRDITVVVRSTVCLRRIDGKWLITHEHISFPINPEDWSAVVDATPYPRCSRDLGRWLAVRPRRRRPGWTGRLGGAG